MISDNIFFHSKCLHSHKLENDRSFFKNQYKCDLLSLEPFSINKRQYLSFLSSVFVAPYSRNNFILLT